MFIECDVQSVWVQAKRSLPISAMPCRPCAEVCRILDEEETNDENERKDQEETETTTM